MEEGEKAEDTICDLPDAIVHLILSFVATKSVIIASSLSKRWREISAEHLAYANNLDFGEDFSKRQTPNQFSENLNKILSVNNSDKIDKFKLLFSPRNEQHKSNAINWIKFATSRGIREFDLDFCRHIHHHFLIQTHVMNREEAFELPSFLFDCKSLTTVKLSRCILALPEKYAGFGALQTLCLREVHVTNNMLESLLSSCLLLEVLVLKEIGSLSKIRILTAARLKKLTVYECYNASALQISGPNIRSLLISAGHLDCCDLENMTSLEEVFIGTRGDEFGGVLYIFMKVLRELAHVRAMTLYLGHLVVMSSLLISNLMVFFLLLEF